MPRRKTKDEFIKDAIAIHGDKYDYSLVNYINSKKKITIVCSKHSYFYQTPEKHLEGAECPDCTKERLTNRFSLGEDAFIRRSIEIHGLKYDYSKVKYKNNKTKVIIICPTHGQFFQVPNSHLIGYGCKKCAIENQANKCRSTKDEFIKKAINMHGKRYDYSLVDYIKNNKNVTIICKTHGRFEQTPSSHLSGANCPKCIGRNKTTDEFIKEAYEIHKTKYDYRKVEYIHSTKKICIICPTHGEFNQTPIDHLQGRGCPKCKGKNKTTEDYIKEAQHRHGNKYDYSKVVYTKSGNNITIICPKHGEFEQLAANHLAGKGCKECMKEINAHRCKMGIYKFVERAKDIHKNKYDYSLVDYKNIDSKIKIICPQHGVFEQTPGSHLIGCGCPKCANKDRGENRKIGKERFIQLAKEKYANIFDYSEIVYVDFQTTVKITCKKHGTFTQNPAVHLRSKFGCPKCGTEYTSQLHKLSKEEFIKRSNEIHEMKFDYTRVHYINNSTKVKIICPIHGIFEQTPVGHLSGMGCQKCAGQIVTKEEYIQRAKNKHGNKYDYSNIQYKGIKKCMQYICPEHGLIKQQAGDHLKSGCRFCAKNVPIDKCDFLKLAHEKFGNKFDYSQINYIGYKNTPISIICPKHGAYMMIPSSHIKSRSGCVKCGNEISADKKRITKSEFILRSSNIHKNKYDYSLIPNDIKLKDTVSIICPKHGIFQIKAAWHLHAKVACSKCSGRNKTTEEYIEEARNTHGDKYDYSQVAFCKAIDKIKIVCPKHGAFKQQANLHLMGAGCPKCAMSHMENKVMRSLEKRKIKYEYQKTFEWLKYKGKQFLDLYLPEFNIAIECQGIQHFVPTERTGGATLFHKQCQMDKNKYELCNEHGIRVLYYCTKGNFIPAKYLDKIYNSITEILEEIERLKIK